MYLKKYNTKVIMIDNIALIQSLKKNKHPKKRSFIDKLFNRKKKEK